jgi:RNA recognition motif-containing protein
VTGAKLVTSAKCPGSKCFGFVTMSTAEEAEAAIKNLSNTEIAKDQKITVEKVNIMLIVWLAMFETK